MLGATKLLRTAFTGVAALVIVFGAATSAQAGGGHHGHGHWHGHGGGGWGWGWAGPAFVGGLALGALATPYYGYGYGAPCHRERHVYYTRSGHRVVRYVRVCY